MCTDRVFEDSGLCALELARVLMVFAGDAMLPTRLWVKMDELRSQGARGCRIVQLRTSEGATTRWATKGRLRISSGTLELRPGFLHVLCCSQPQIKSRVHFCFWE